MDFKIMENELSLRQIIKISYKFFFKNIALISMIVLIIFTPICIVNAIISVQQWNIIESLGNSEEVLNLLYKGDYATLERFNTAMLAAAQKSLISLLIVLFFEPLGKMGVAYVIKQEIFGITPAFSLALEKTFAHWKTLFIATIFYIFLIFTGCTLFFFPALLIRNVFLILIPFVFLNIVFYFYNFAIILSGKKEIECLKYSFLLIRKKYAKAFIFISVFTIPKYLMYVLVSILIPIDKADFLVFFMQNMILSLICSYFYVCAAVWYLNLEYINNGGVYFDKSV